MRICDCVVFFIVIFLIFWQKPRAETRGRKRQAETVKRTAVERSTRSAVKRGRKAHRKAHPGNYEPKILPQKGRTMPSRTPTTPATRTCGTAPHLAAGRERRLDLYSFHCTTLIIFLIRFIDPEINCTLLSFYVF